MSASSVPPVATANDALLVVAKTFFDEFAAVFGKHSDGTLDMRIDALARIEQWFNRVHPVISFATTIPLHPIAFTESREQNHLTLLHVYAVSYACLLRMAHQIGMDVPPRFAPQLASSPVSPLVRTVSE